MSNGEQSSTIDAPVPGAGRRRSHIRGTAVQAMLGFSAVVFAVVALAGLFVFPLAEIATIAAGAALLLEGVGLAVAEHSRSTDGAPRLDGSVRIEVLAGAGAITLAILGLVGIERLTLLPVAAIALGSGMLLASGASSVARVRARADAEERTASDTLFTRSGVHSVIGSGSIVLGILGVLGNAPIVLTLVAVLAIGAGLLMSGASLGAHLMAMFDRTSSPSRSS